MKPTKVQKLVADAKLKGFEIKVTESSSEENAQIVDIFKRDRRSTTKLLVGIRMYINEGKMWSAFRTDVPLDMAANIRTLKAIREYLELD